MTGHDYEYAVAGYLKWHGYRAVRVTRASGDYGVDVVCTRHDRRYAVQCKYYTHPVGLSAVQQAVAGKAQYGCECAMVVTNTVLTKAARELAESNDVTVLENIRPRQLLPRPLTLLLRLLLTLVWAAALGLVGSRAWREAGGLPTRLPLAPLWRLTGLLLLLPPVVWLITAVLRAVLWRFTRHRQLLLERLERLDTEDLEQCVIIGKALAMQTYPAEAFRTGGSGTPDRRVREAFP